MLPYVLLALWILLLLLFRKLNIYFFVFLVGSVGLFCFSMYFGIDNLEKYLEYGVTYGVYLVGKITGFCTAYPEYSMITVYYNSQALSFFVDYECSGLIEMLIYICLLLFYPLYSYTMRAIYAIMGAIYIFLANIVRVFVICTIARFLGPSMFFISHTVIARIMFFIFMVVLYYTVFTKPHILRQKVGDLTNDS
jgi:exosortase family protein XrtG